jgi:hypothetical protein
MQTSPKEKHGVSPGLHAQPEKDPHPAQISLWQDKPKPLHGSPSAQHGSAKSPQIVVVELVGK